MIFFRTDQGFLPATQIDIIKHAAKDTKGQAIISDGKIVGETVDFENRLISIAGAIGFEVLSICADEDGAPTLISVPVTSWGLNVYGTQIPVTPEYTEGVTDAHIVREKESGRMWDWQGVEVLSAEDWLAEHGGK